MSAILGAFDRYSYVSNDPTNFIDPSGLLMIEYYCYTIDTYWSYGQYLYGTDTTTQCFFRIIPDESGADDNHPSGRRGGGGGGESPESRQNECPIGDLTPLDNEAQRMEDGESVILDRLTESKQKALTCLQESILEIGDSGGPHFSGKRGALSFTVVSAYRPESYQRHFWEILSKLSDDRINFRSCKGLRERLLRERETSVARRRGEVQ